MPFSNVSCYSVVQPTFDINSSWSLGYNRKLACGSSLGNYFTPGFVFSQHTTPRKITLHRHCPLRVPSHTLVKWSLVDSFLVPRKIHARSVKDSNHGPLDMQSNALPQDQRATIIWPMDFEPFIKKQNVFKIVVFRHVLPSRLLNIIITISARM